jgi:hypothetical protein
MTEPPRSEPLLLRELLGESFDPKQYKLHCARRTPQGDDPLRAYERGWSHWLYWNKYRPRRNEWTKPHIFSVMQVEPASDEWIFGGIFKVLGQNPNEAPFDYDVELVRDFTEALIGRLRVRFWPAARVARPFLERYFHAIEVVEVSRESWSGRPFPGFDSINDSFQDLEEVVRRNRDDWRHPLENMKGVYVWNDHLTGKAYIGSGTAETGGLWSRLCSYISSGHGGNKWLRELVNAKGIDYLRQHFHYALLEYWPPRIDDAHVLARESYWKEVFGTRSPEHGYNA